MNKLILSLIILILTLILSVFLALCIIPDKTEPPDKINNIILDDNWSINNMLATIDTDEEWNNFNNFSNDFDKRCLNTFLEVFPSYQKYQDNDDYELKCYWNVRQYIGGMGKTLGSNVKECECLISKCEKGWDTKTAFKEKKCYENFVEETFELK